MQVKLEKRFSQGVYGLVSYTLSKLTGERGPQYPARGIANGGLTGAISPYQRDRNYTISQSDTPHVFSAALVYELPFGTGKRFVNTSNAVVNALVSGWQLSTIYKFQSAPPMFFRSPSFCNVPGQFRAACIPAITDPGAVFAQDKDSFDPALGPLFNKDAFEPVTAFNYYFGTGNRVEESIRGFAYQNQDLTLMKNTRLPAARTCSSASRRSTCGTGTRSAWQWHFGNQAVQQRHRQPELRHME